LNHRKLMRLHREKLEREQLIRTIREEAIKSVSSELSEGIVRMTEKTVSPRLSLRTTGGTMVVDTDDIVYLKAEGNYTILVTFQQSEMVLIGLGALSKELVSDNFVRADRSTIVNINHISRLNKMQRVCVFKSNDGTEVETTLLQPAFKRLEEYL
jgi:DNA-binding LytR/AlgR family response regulator